MCGVTIVLLATVGQSATSREVLNAIGFPVVSSSTSLSSYRSYCRTTIASGRGADLVSNAAILFFVAWGTAILPVVVDVTGVVLSVAAVRAC